MLVKSCVLRLLIVLNRINLSWSIKTYEMAYLPVLSDHIQLLHDNGSHWFCLFSSSGKVQVCDNLCTNFAFVSKKCWKYIYQMLVKNRKLKVMIPPVQKQEDSINCGIFALAFSSLLLDVKSPIHARFVVSEMRCIGSPVV